MYIWPERKPVLSKDAFYIIFPCRLLQVLVGNRLHLAFKRQVDPLEAEAYAEKNNMGFYEISPLVNFNVTESFQASSNKYAFSVVSQPRPDSGAL